MKWVYNKKRITTRKLPLKRIVIAIVALVIVPLIVFRPVSAAIAFRAAATANNAGGAGNLSIAMPTGTVQNDVMVAVIGVRGGTGVTITAPTGWVELNTTTSLTSIRSSMFYKVAGASEAGPYSFTFSVSNKASGVISSYSGVDLVSPIVKNNVQANASSTTMTAPSVNTTHDNSWVVAGFTTATGTTVTPGSSMTERGEDASTGAGAGSRTTTQLQDINQTTAGSTGTKTATAGGGAVNIGHIAVLTPKINMKMSAYRWFQNADSTTPGTALALQNTAASAGAGPVRLQMLTHIEDGKTSPYYGVKLKYATRGADNVCDASGTNETYQDIVSRTKTKSARPATGANDASAGSNPWGTPAYAAGRPDDYTSFNQLTMSFPTSQYLKLTDFGFNVPSTATIHGVRIVTNAWSDFYDPGNDEVYLAASLVKAGTVGGSPTNLTITSTSTTNHIEYPTSMYGNTLTPSDVNSSSFGVAFQAEVSFTPSGNTANVNSVSVQVVYSDGGTVQFQQNATPVDGAQAVNGGLTHSSDPITLGSYNESNIAATQPNGANQTSGDLLHDFSLNLGSLSAGTYCFMAFRDDDTALGTTHDVIPQLTILSSQTTQANYRWFDNANSATPGAVLAAQDTAASKAVNAPFRLRQRLAIDSGTLGVGGQAFKLQYAEKVGTCDIGFSGETYADLDNSTLPEANYGATGSNDMSNGEVGTWSNPSNATGTSNSSYATFNSPGFSGSLTSMQLKVTNFGFSIPTNATISSVTVQVYGGSTDLSGDYQNTDLYDRQLVLYDMPSGSSAGTDYIDAATQPSPINQTPAQWGLSLTPADVNDSGFGFAVAAHAGYDDINLQSTQVFIDAISIAVYYTLPAGPLEYYNNTSVSDLTTITSSGNDPTNASRPTVYQSYRETDTFTNNVASISAGSDGIWDFAITSTASASGKTYCIRTVKADNSPLEVYSNIPEISITAAGPTLNQMTRGGGGVVNGLKQNYTW